MKEIMQKIFGRMRGFVCMIQTMKLLIRKQIGRNATYKNGTFIAEDGTDLLALFKEKSKNGAGYELYSKRWLQYAKNGWKKENDLVLKIGFDSSGLYDIGQEKGYGAAQNMWMKGVSQSMFEARV